MKLLVKFLEELQEQFLEEKFLEQFLVGFDAVLAEIHGRIVDSTKF